jgi:methylated-DNA-[protein]-cysteine S-methyltransferase
MGSTTGEAKRYVCKWINTPVGRLKLIASDDGLAGILFETGRPGRVRLKTAAEDAAHPVLVETERQLGEYFAGFRREFALTLDPEGTPFQRKVWKALLTIPFGETRSYGQIARQIGRPTAVRAVGAANGSNPISIVTPGRPASSPDSAAASTPRHICWRWKVRRATA